MLSPGRLLRRIRFFFTSRRLDDDLDEELQFHLEMATRSYIDRGLTPEQARNAARRDFGGVGHHRDESRDARGVRPVEDLLQDLRIGARTIMKQRTYAVVAILTLAVGIGATTSLWAAVHRMLIAPFPYAQERLRVLPADLPDVTPEERRRLLHFMVVGGGPTGVEFAAELHDLIDESLRDNYPDLVGIPRITLFEAMPTILGGFDKDLRDYTINHFNRQGIELQLEKKVTCVVEDELHFDDGSVEEGGLIVWSTGYAPTDLIRNSPFEKERGRLITDPFLRIPDYPDVYAAGDCAVIAGAKSPQTAQFAMQAGKYLGKAFNRIAEGKEVKEFEFNDLGMLAYIGNEQALAEVPKAKLRWHGALTYLAWRSAYLTRLVSFKNKVLVLFDWIKTRVFGRDMSKF